MAGSCFLLYLLWKQIRSLKHLLVFLLRSMAVDERSLDSSFTISTLAPLMSISIDLCVLVHIGTGWHSLCVRDFYHQIYPLRLILARITRTFKCDHALRHFIVTRPMLHMVRNDSEWNHLSLKAQTWKFLPYFHERVVLLFFSGYHKGLFKKTSFSFPQIITLVCLQNQRLCRLRQGISVSHSSETQKEKAELRKKDLKCREK